METTPVDRCFLVDFFFIWCCYWQQKTRDFRTILATFVVLLHIKCFVWKIERINYFIPLWVKRVREVANLTERKNLHTPVYGVKELVCLSVCLWSTLTQIISGLAEQNGLKNCNFGCQSCFCKPVFFLRQLIYDFLAENNYPDSPHLQGGMKLATHISPLLN